MRTTAILLILFVSAGTFAADLENGAKLHRACALCHGQWSQGIQGGLYPRLAGLSQKYLKKQCHDYKEGVRTETTMTLVGGFANMSEQDVEDLSAFIASIDLKEKAPLDIPTAKGNSDVGEELYQDDCKSCHGRKAEGKDSKSSPMLAGQYTEYLQKQIAIFKTKVRYHDNDPEDETFDDYSDSELQDILSYISTLD